MFTSFSAVSNTQRSTMHDGLYITSSPSHHREMPCNNSSNVSVTRWLVQIDAIAWNDLIMNALFALAISVPLLYRPSFRRSLKNWKLLSHVFRSLFLAMQYPTGTEYERYRRPGNSQVQRVLVFICSCARSAIFLASKLQPVQQ